MTRRPAANAERITARKLDNGWATAGKTRVRAATAADIDAIGTLTTLAGAPFEQELQADLAEGTAGAGLRIGLDHGHDAYLQYMAQRFTDQQHDNPIRPYLYAALVLVAEHRDTGIVGTLVAYPPLGAAAQILQKMETAGHPDRERYKTMLGMGVFLTRIKAIAVAEHARGNHLGASLLKRAKQVYDQCQYQITYGAMPENRGLDIFYRRAGFTIHDPGAALDLFAMFGHDIKIWPGPGERLFSRQHPTS